MNEPLHAATDPTASAWVSANAGAGKTHLLANRVTRLLLAGADPSRILCLTYTKAAASEMASRLFARLGEWALLPDAALTEKLAEIGATLPSPKTLRHSRTLFAQALETPGGLKIQTIHSFCQHVLARFPVEAGIPARFAVLDERSAAELMAESRNRILERAAHGDARLSKAIGLIATRASDMRFAEILDSAMADSGKLRNLLDDHHGEANLLRHVRALLGVAEGEDEAAILSRFCLELKKEKLKLEGIVQGLSGRDGIDGKLSRGIADFLDAATDEAGCERLRDVLLTATGERRKQLLTKAAEKAQPGSLTYLDSLCERLLVMEERRKAAATAALTEAIVHVAGAVIERYDALKRYRAALDYDDLIRATLALLEGRDAASWVLFKLDNGLAHILVDEAQDTSPEQWKIIGKLAKEFFAGKGTHDDSHPRTLFAVGDEKQSIFSFQGADPAEFGRHRGHFKALAEGAGLAFADLRPPVSRRSARQVLEFVDALFAVDAARDGLTSSGDAIHHDPHRAEIGRVEIWPLVPAPKVDDPDLWNRPVDAFSPNSAQVQLAARIAARIAQWIRDGVTLPGAAAPLTAGDIMILVRRRNAFAEEMIRQLIDKGVPVAGADRMVLMEQIAIADLVALGRFALLPEDELNLAALLKSPLVGLSEDDLFDLAHPRTGRLWDELRARKDERPSFAHAHSLLSDLLAKADYLPPFEFYARALGQGLRKKLVARLGAEGADAIDEFLALALAHESAHPPSLESFLDWFQKGASEVKRYMEQKGGAVRVMTVHGAKGLEADIVILPDTVQPPDQERKEPLLYTDDSVFYGVPKALDTEPVRRAKSTAQAREQREYRRLLYVAATRAREFLVVCGYQTRNNTQATAWYEHLRDAGLRIGRQETIDGQAVIAAGAPLSVGAAGEDRLAATATVLPGYFARAAMAEPASRVLRPSEAVGLDEMPATSPLGDQGRRFRRGLLIHALLARLPDIAPSERDAAASAYLRRQGLSADEAALLIAETNAVLNDSAFAALFAPGSRSEVALAAELPELGHARISGQIDRLAVTADALLIADFKTNRPPPADALSTPRLYIAQMALYRAALAKIYSGKRIDCALIWTDGARLMPLPPELLDAEIARISADSPAI